MNNRITFQQLTSMVADRIGREYQETESELKAIFERISSEILTKGKAILPEIGEFTVENGSVVFTPCPSMARGVNKPFNMFEAVDLHDEVTDEMLADVVIEEDRKPISESLPDVGSEVLTPDIENNKMAEIVTETTITEDEINEASETETVTEPDNIEPETISESHTSYEETEPEETVDNTISPTYYPYDPDEDDWISPWKMFWIGIVIGIALGAAACFFYVSSVHSQTGSENHVTEDIESAE